MFIYFLFFVIGDTKICNIFNIIQPFWAFSRVKSLKIGALGSGLSYLGLESTCLPNVKKTWVEVKGRKKKKSRTTGFLKFKFLSL